MMGNNIKQFNFNFNFIETRKNLLLNQNLFFLAGTAVVVVSVEVVVDSVVVLVLVAETSRTKSIGSNF